MVGVGTLLTSEEQITETKNLYTQLHIIIIPFSSETQNKNRI